MIGLFRDNLRAEGRLGGQDAVEADEMEVGTGNQGGQALENASRSMRSGSRKRNLLFVSVATY